MQVTESKLIELFQAIHEKLSINIEQLTTNVGSLAARVNSISEQMEPPIQIQNRFTHINIRNHRLTQVEDAETKQISRELKNWVGDLIRVVFSNGFKFFEEGKMNDKSVKAYCAENILYNIIELIRANDMSAEQIRQMSEFMDDEVINYLIEKYPKSEEKEYNLTFANKIKLVENLENNENDLVFRSKVEFEFNERGNYTSAIMKFLNYVLTLPDEKVSLGKEGGKEKFVKLEDLFHREMGNFFRKIFSKQEVFNMKNYGRPDPKRTSEIDVQDEIYGELSEKFEIYELIENESELMKLNPKLSDDVKYYRKCNDETKNKLRVMAKKPELRKQDDSLNLLKKESQENLTQREQLYKEKVEGYTKYATDRKLSKNISVFDEEDIENGKIDLKNSAVIRVVTKWCKELESHYNNISKRQEPFRMMDGSLKFLSSSDLKFLEKILAGEKQRIREFMREIMGNNYEQQELLSKEDFYDEISYFSDFESKVGLFNAHMLMNYKNYLINYLNALIHGLLRAMNFYSYYTDSNYKYFYSQESKTYTNDHLFHRKNSGIQVSEKNQIPMLISFFVDDLLRCRCYSGQDEITALYNELQRFDHEKPDLLKIVNVRSRLQYVTKDIKINLLYRNKIVIEVQLGIKNDKSKFIEYSNRFNHFIYELQRSAFDSITELCSIWMTCDPRADYFLDKLKSLSVNKAKREGHKCQTQEMQTLLPFKCGNCQRYINHVVYLKKHRFCQFCQKKICLMCAIKNIKSYPEMKVLIPEFPFPKFDQKVEFCGQTVPETGFLMDMRSLSSLPKKYRILEIDGKEKICILKNYHPIPIDSSAFKKYYVETSDGELKFKKTDEYVSFRVREKGVELLNGVYDLLDTDDLDDCVLARTEGSEFKTSITSNLINQEYIIPCKFQEAESKEYESFNINCLQLNDYGLLKEGNLKFPKIKKVNAMENHIRSLSVLTGIFPNVETLVLTDNQLREIEEEPLYNLKQLYLEKNKFKTVSVGGFINLSYLSLRSCQSLEEVAPSIGDCKKLKQLNLESCKNLSHLPSSIVECFSLTKLLLSNSGICQLPDNFGKLMKLKVLETQNCTSLKKIPESLGRCMDLEVFNAKGCQSLQFLPPKFVRLRKLKLFDVSECFMLKEIPLGTCPDLYYFSVSYCESLKELPASLANCKKLQFLEVDNVKAKLNVELKSYYHLKELDFSSNPLIESLQQIGKCKKLKSLYLRKSPVTALPLDIGNCFQLKELNLLESMVEELPQTIGICSKLQILQIQNTRISAIPEQIGTCLELKVLKAFGTKIKEIPKSLGNCQKLRFLQLFSCPYLKQLPLSLKNCTLLQQLHIGPYEISFPCQLLQISSLKLPYYSSVFSEEGQNKFEFSISEMLQVFLHSKKVKNISAENELEWVPSELISKFEEEWHEYPGDNLKGYFLFILDSLKREYNLDPEGMNLMIHDQPEEKKVEIRLSRREEGSSCLLYLNQIVSNLQECGREELALELVKKFLAVEDYLSAQIICSRILETSTHEQLKQKIRAIRKQLQKLHQ